MKSSPLVFNLRRHPFPLNSIPTCPPVYIHHSFGSNSNSLYRHVFRSRSHKPCSNSSNNNNNITIINGNGSNSSSRRKRRLSTHLFNHLTSHCHLGIRRPWAMLSTRFLGKFMEPVRHSSKNGRMVCFRENRWGESRVRTYTTSNAASAKEKVSRANLQRYGTRKARRRHPFSSCNPRCTSSYSHHISIIHLSIQTQTFHRHSSTLSIFMANSLLTDSSTGWRVRRVQLVTLPACMSRLRRLLQIARRCCRASINSIFSSNSSLSLHKTQRPHGISPSTRNNR